MGRMLARLSVILIAVVLVGIACKQEMPDKETRQLAVYPTPKQGEARIRVLLKETFDTVTLAVNGPYRLQATYLDGRSETGASKLPVTVQATATEKGVRVGKDEYESLDLIPERGTRLFLNNQPYPGTILLRRSMKMRKGKPTPQLLVVSRLGIEEYLLGVVGSEMPANWSAEALRAQAVVSRSYALYYAETRKNRPFDVRPTVMSQVWKPSEKTGLTIRMAVNSTRGVIVTDDYRLFPAFFHAQCGGYTADAHRVFLKREIKTLTGRRCDYCAVSGEAPPPWSLTLTQQDLSARLNRAGLLRGTVAALRPLDAAGRPVIAARGVQRVFTVETQLTNGAVYTLPAEEFRAAIGRREMRSTFFGLGEAPDNNQFVLVGYGNGHGVGMCQYGARYLAAKKGFTYQDILRYYYTGATLVRVWD